MSENKRPLTPKMREALSLLASADNFYADNGLRMDPTVLVVLLPEQYSETMRRTYTPTERIDARTTEGLRTRGLVDWQFKADGRSTADAHLTESGRKAAESL